jgi:oligoendopeptidase F
MAAYSRACAAALIALASAAAPLAARPPASSPPAADLGPLFADWPAWEAAAGELERSIARCGGALGEWHRPEDLLRALRAKDDVHRLAAEVDGYLQLRLAWEPSDADTLSHRGRMEALGERWDGEVAIRLDEALRRLGPARVESWLSAEAALSPYRWLLRQAVADPPHALEPAQARAIAEIESERDATRRVHTALDFVEGPVAQTRLASGKSLEVTPALARNLALEIADPADRRAARSAWLQALGGRAATHAALLESVVRRERFLARERGFTTALQASFAREGVADSTVRAMLDEARRAGPAVARWHAARRARLGLESYGTSDVRAPLAGLPSGISWNDARELVLASAAPLGDEVVAVLERAFAERWIDAIERPGKSPVGFSTFVYRDRPFVSIVYRGTALDLLRLTHELGHAVHHRLAFEAQPFGPARPSVLVGETVAAIHEGLLVRHLAARAASLEERRALVDYEAQLVHRSFVATALDADFELAAHEQATEFSATALSALYRARLEAFHGGALRLDPEDGNGWMEAPHFFSAPFTMARYPLSFAAAARLVEGLLDGDAARAAAARGRYLALLRAGGSEAPLALLAAAGADLGDPETVSAVPRRLGAIAAALEEGK